MVKSFDRIVIGVPKLADAIFEYEKVLGASFWCSKNDDGEPVAWVGLGNVVLELREQEIEQPLIMGLVFIDDEVSRQIHNDLQLSLAICDGSVTGEFRNNHPSAQNTDLMVDHLVLRTSNAEACIALFSVGLGIRLALDKTVPKWGGRMLFFRLGQLTLEVIESSDTKLAGNDFWGIAYQCSNLADKVSQLEAQGVVLSDIRAGRKPGTQVATIKSHALEIPTMLIEPPAK